MLQVEGRTSGISDTVVKYGEYWPQEWLMLVWHWYPEYTLSQLRDRLLWAADLGLFSTSSGLIKKRQKRLTSQPLAHKVLQAKQSQPRHTQTWVNLALCSSLYGAKARRDILKRTATLPYMPFTYQRSWKRQLEKAVSTFRLGALISGMDRSKPAPIAN